MAHLSAVNLIPVSPNVNDQLQYFSVFLVGEMPHEPRKMSERLRWLREERFGPRGRAAIAGLAGVTGNTWKAYEERGTIPSAEVVANLLSEIPELNPMWLLLGSGDPFLRPGAEGGSSGSPVEGEEIVLQAFRQANLVGRAKLLALAADIVGLEGGLNLAADLEREFSKLAGGKEQDQGRRSRRRTGA